MTTTATEKIRKSQTTWASELARFDDETVEIDEVEFRRSRPSSRASTPLVTLDPAPVSPKSSKVLWDKLRKNICQASYPREAKVEDDPIYVLWKALKNKYKICNKLEGPCPKLPRNDGSEVKERVSWSRFEAMESYLKSRGGTSSRRNSARSSFFRQRGSLLEIGGDVVHNMSLPLSPKSPSSAKGDAKCFKGDEKGEVCAGVMLDMFMRKGKGGIDKILENIAIVVDAPLYSYAKDAIKRDIFLASMWEDLTEFYKTTTVARKSKYAWPHLDTSSIRQHVNEVVKIKRMVSCLKAEVDNSIFRFKLLNTHVPSRFETMRERTDRMGDFWSQFHSRCRRNELPPISVGGSDGSPARRRPYSAVRLNDVKPKKPMCFAEEDQWAMIRRIETQNRALAETRESSPSRTSRSRNGGRLLSPPKSTFSTLSSMPSSVKGRHVSQGPGVSMLRKRQVVINSYIPPKSPSAPILLPAQELQVPKGTLLPPLHSGAMPSRVEDSEGAAECSGFVFPTDSYLEACQRCWIVPTPLPFVTGHSWSLNAAGRDLMDSDLRAMAVMLQDMASIDAIDLSGNVLLTERALVPFIERLFGEPASSTLRTLSFRECKHIGALAMDAIRRLLSNGDGAMNLRSLDLSHVQISMKCHLKFSKAIQNHKALESLSLGDSGLGGNSWVATQCVELLMSCQTLSSLDLSWNCFDTEVFQHLGKNLIERKRLKNLKIANCSSAVVDATSKPPPITFFLERLQEDDKLTRLDVSLNRMDFRAMLVIEDALEFHKVLQKLDLSHNALGVLGMRSALRLLARNSSGLVHFEALGCYSRSAVGCQTFNFTDPSGSYALELDRPYHRAILRMIYKQCDKFNQPADKCMMGLNYSIPPWHHCTKDPRGFYDVPQKGRLSFHFSLEGAFEQAHISDDDFTGFIQNHNLVTKVQPAFRKVIPLLSVWKGLDGQSMDQAVFLEALGKDFYLTAADFEFLCHSTQMGTCEIIRRLLPCVIGGIAANYLCLQLTPNVREFIVVHSQMRKYLDLNIENPTGHYTLDLANSGDHAVATQLLLLDQWEIVIDRKRKRYDISQRGNGSHLRNETYQHSRLAMHYKTVSEWTLPEYDELEFDYVSGKRCPHDALVLNPQSFDNILVSFYDADCQPSSKLEVMRMVSNHLYVTSKQCREILGTFKQAADRVEAFVILYLRIVDVANAKIIVVRFEGDKDLQELRERLGYTIMFPFIQPENARFGLNFSYYDQRICCNMLLQLMEKEGLQNIRDPEYIHADGKVDPLPLGVPRAWLKMESVPTEGLFRCKYMCAPENRKFSFRTSLAETYGYFRMDVAEDKVMWWTGLQEPPEDVLDFLEFLLCNFKNTVEAFDFIDGEGGNGVITLREFEDGIREMNCKKFQGKDQTARINSVFRYLDPGGEGSVSREEWSILSQLWEEYQLSISEFVGFLQRTFGDDLEEAWNFLDDDDSGELTFEEFTDAVGKIGYFGPARCVFSLLDRSDDGTISIDEFEILDQYKVVNDLDSRFGSKSRAEDF